MFPSSLPSPRFGAGLATVLVLTALAFLSVAPVPARASAPASEPAPVAAPAVRTPHAARPVQVADEIVRRLRRLGINFSKTRILNPYDPEGEVC